jgi:L-threonylcarbamoyladenylate synthase
MKVPLAAPSANLFGKTSPTQASHVMDSFNSGDVFVLNGGDCTGGIESTVIKLDVQKKQIVILRPGLVTLSMLAQNPTVLRSGYTVAINNVGSKDSPGQLAHHYMPDKPLCLVDESSSMDVINQKFRKIDLMDLPNEAVLAARSLYGRLREMDSASGEAIVLKIKSQWTGELWDSIKERLSKASSYDFRGNK